jgi:hypothetical protein
MANLLGQIFGVLILIALVFIGFKGFTKAGVQITSSRSIRGTWVGILGIVLACSWACFTYFSGLWGEIPGKTPSGNVAGAGQNGNDSNNDVATGPFRDLAGNFTINCPVRLRDATQWSVVTNEPKMHVFSGTDRRRGLTFNVTYADVPVGQALDLQTETAETIKGLGLTPTRNEVFAFAEQFPACEMEGSEGEGKSALRVITQTILVHNRVYFLLVMGPKNALDDEKTLEFLDSFDLIFRPEISPLSVMPDEEGTSGRGGATTRGSH